MSQQFPENPKVGSPTPTSPSHIQTAPESTNSIQPENQTQGEPQPPVEPQLPTIVDVVSAYQTGNYLPLLHCLNNKLIPLDFFDQAGYHPIHSAIAGNLIPMIIIFLDHYKVDVNLRAKNGQTPLMIAANYGNLQVVKLLCDRGASVNEQEDTRFSALMYSVKQNHLAVFAYLLSQNADIQVRDTNGCSVAHWAAYKNNAFMLKILHNLGVDMEILDYTGMTPLDRAVQSDGFQAVKFLLEVGNGTMPPNMEYAKISNSDMKEILRKKFYPSYFETKWREGWKYFLQNSQKVTIGIYASLWVMAMLVFVHAVMFQGSNYTMGLIFVLFGLFFMGYTYWYFTRTVSVQHKSTNRRGYGKLISSALDNSFGESRMDRGGRELNQRMSYGSLNKLLPNDFQRTTNEFNSPTSTFPTFLHELAYLAQTGMYKEVERFNEEDYCPTCLIKRSPRSSHCKQEKVCVDEFCHYSYCLGKSITLNDHYLYLIQLINQMILLSFFFLLIWDTYKAHNWKVFAVEVGYILWQQYGLLYASVYTLMLILALYNGFFLAVELYGVMKNITHYEIFNAQKCSYLYRIKLDRRGSYVKSFDNPYDKGNWNNIKAYLSRVFHSKGESMV